MKIMERMQPYMFGLGIGLAGLTGCATNQMLDRPLDQIEPVKAYSKIDKAKDVLGVKSERMLKMFPNDYIALRDDDGALRNLAGIYAGTVKVKKTKKGYLANGSYSEYKHPKAIQRVLVNVDTDADKIITPQEIRDLAIKLYKKNAR